MKRLILALVVCLVTTISNAQAPVYSANMDHSITLTDAVTMTNAFRARYPSAIIANAFGKDAIIQILNQSGCTGVRFYNALDIDGTVHLVAVGITSDGTNMTSGYIAERSVCCLPDHPRCFPRGGLNAN